MSEPGHARTPPSGVGGGYIQITPRFGQAALGASPGPTQGTIAP
jgi:hypothetical protein